MASIILISLQSYKSESLHTFDLFTVSYYFDISIPHNGHELAFFFDVPEEARFRTFFCNPFDQMFQAFCSRKARYKNTVTHSLNCARLWKCSFHFSKSPLYHTSLPTTTNFIHLWKKSCSNVKHSTEAKAKQSVIRFNSLNQWNLL